jgi:anti-anti-sigma regulatory factor
MIRGRQWSLREDWSRSVRAKNQFGKIVLCGLNESVEKVFQTSGFSKLLTVVGSQDEAIQHLQQV